MSSVRPSGMQFTPLPRSELLVLGPVTRHHQHWFDENDNEIQIKLEEKDCLLRSYQNNPPVWRRKLPSLICASYAPCRTPGLVPSPTKSKAMSTDMTQRGSMMHPKPSMGHNPLDRSPRSVQRRRLNLAHR